ncbi:hypothetical protein T07_3262, partial [Trichinella nelsoni]
LMAECRSVRHVPTLPHDTTRLDAVSDTSRLDAVSDTSRGVLEDVDFSDTARHFNRYAMS